MPPTTPIPLLLTLLTTLTTQFYPLDKQKSIYSIPYTRTFRPDLVDKYVGCQYRVSYSQYLYPDGLRDMAMIYSNPYSFGSPFRCQPKEVYLKMFGGGQDYAAIRNPAGVIELFSRANNGKFRNLIIDWKNPDITRQSADILGSFVKTLQANGMQVYVKVPASHLCKQVKNSPYILGIEQTHRIIVQMYGEDPSAYMNLNQIFLSEKSQLEPDSDYPNPSCPKFPSYTQLTKQYPNKDFYIEKTLQQEEPGYMGREFLNALKGAEPIYNKEVFYDAFPPNVIRI